MDQLLEAILLGIIQGTAEWLPISSTGHLRLAEYFMNREVPLLFDVTLHIGTLIVVLFFFREDIRSILSALVHREFTTEHGQLIPRLAIATIPTAIIGILFYNTIDSVFRTPIPIGSALIASGILLFGSKLAKEKTEHVNLSAAVLFGIAQGVAIVPGMSRSGTTIATALLLGLKREKAFTFSFLLSIPAIIGAEGWTLYKQHALLAQSGLGWTEIFVGVIVSMIVGYLALRLLWRAIEKERFYLFSIYSLTLGAVLIVLSVRGL